MNNQQNPLLQWLSNHTRAFLFAIGEILQTPFSSLMTLIVIGIAMALPTWLFVALQNFQNIDQHWSVTPSISLYLKQNVAPSEISELNKRLQQNPAVKKVQYISAQQGLNDFEKVSQLGNMLTQLQKNPLPAVLVVTPNNSSQSSIAIQNLYNELRQWPEVDLAQLDITWVKRLQALVTLGQRLAYSLAFLLGVGVILIVGNTIRLIMQSKQQEIKVLKLIGATHSFIRRPLLYRGILLGVVGALIAWVLINCIFAWLAPPAQFLAQSYQYTFFAHGLSLESGVFLIIICAFLGWFGSLLAMQKYLLCIEEM